jgi:hypothetical protein
MHKRNLNKACSSGPELLVVILMLTWPWIATLQKYAGAQSIRIE